MRVAVTGGTGFVGSHLCRELVRLGHEVVVISRGVDKRPAAIDTALTPDVTVVACDLGSSDSLDKALGGCSAVVHCAGINREHGSQTYQRVHVDATRYLLDAAEQNGVEKFVLVSFLRARPGTESPYHESKWQSEEIVRGSTLQWTVLKPGMMFGRGDGMLETLGRALATFPVFLGLGKRTVRPVAVEDVVKIIVLAATTDQLDGETIPIVGPEELRFDDTVRIAARSLGKRVFVLPAPLFIHRLVARVAEITMQQPLVSTSQIAMLSEGISEGAQATGTLRADLRPVTPFSVETVRDKISKGPRYTLRDLKRPRFIGGRG
jgi:uncharacterized protein YbjT (DUF2867 family)